MTSPARITIELEPPPTGRGRWHTRTRIDGAMPARSAVVEAIVPVEALEPREPAVTPIAYEAPAECTCLDGLDGWCGVDHANE